MVKNGFAIGIDLGTSNTVAVVRWPDGRTRPLLFDGQPILPSGLYLDESNHLHVGRDAQRMAPLDPARYEPNPKRRIDEQTVLLGDQEGPTVGLLSAILQAIATKAKETCGMMPPAVLTYPAAWGASRRAILQDAATRAGWPSAQMVPEPIAAARYFTDTLHHPLPDGGCLAVFDFGGGTLDVAVVRNDHGRFEVVGSGGAEDLGGLDVDDAIVRHVGSLLAARHPDVWQRLSAPATPVDRRHRRLFWDDVRGAKEMLSRTTMAPLPIPGLDSALHLTREELERVARPLIERAVQATAEVIGRCRLAPGQLTGIFLVGGTSRMPLVSHLLHERLGVPPTALEQPELPVAEGALVELGSYDAPPGFQPAASEPVPVGPPGLPPDRPWYRRPWPYAVAGAAAAVALLAGSLFYYFGPTERPFHALTSVGTVPLPANGTVVGTDIEGGDAYLAAAAEDTTLQLTAVDLATGEKRDAAAVKEESWKWFGAETFGLVAYGETGGQRTIYVYDATTLKEIHSLPISAESWHVAADDHTMVVVDPTKKKLTWIDVAAGAETAEVDLQGTLFPVGNWSDEKAAASLWGGRFQKAYPDNRLVMVSDTGTLQVLDAVKGTLGKSSTAEVLDYGDKAMAYQGRFFVAGAPEEGTGYRLRSYDIDKLGEPKEIYADTRGDVTPQRVMPCGATYVCVLNSARELVVVNFEEAKEAWKKTLVAPDEIGTVLPVGDRILVNYVQDEVVRHVLFSGTGEQLGRGEGWAVPVDLGSALLFDGSVASVSGGSVNVQTSVMSVELRGFGAQSGETTPLGAIDVNPSTCSWDDTYLACAGTANFLLYSFRDA